MLVWYAGICPLLGPWFEANNASLELVNEFTYVPREYVHSQERRLMQGFDFLVRSFSKNE